MIKIFPKMFSVEGKVSIKFDLLEDSESLNLKVNRKVTSMDICT